MREAQNGASMKHRSRAYSAIRSCWKIHFEMSVEDLERLERLWPGLLERLITRRLPGPGAWEQVLQKEADGIKTVIEVG
jgi:hypothetical protein